MKKSLAILLAAAMILAVLAGCAAKPAPAESAAPESEAPAESAPAAPAESETSAEPEPEAQPVVKSALPENYPKLADGDKTFSVWYAWPPPLDGSSYTSPEQFPIWTNIAERTGLNFEFTIIGMAVATEQFNLMVASETLPDILTEPFRWDGGTDAALDQGVFYDVTDLLEENAPDYYELINREENFRDIYTDSGRVGGFWEIAEEEFPPNSGLFIRQDMLEAVGMEAPETYDEMHDVLKAIKDEYSAESPFFLGTSIFSGNLTGGMGFGGGFVNDGGKAVFGVTSDGFKGYMDMLKSWYTEGLIYSDFYSLLDNSVEADSTRVRLVNTNDVAVWYNWCEDIIQYSPESPDYSYAAILDPVTTKGEVTHLASGFDMRINNTNGWAFSGNISEEDAALLCQLANYFYTEEGSLLANWGTEGESFVYNDEGQPMYTDVILDNPELMTNVAIGVYAFFRGARKVNLAMFNQNAMTIYKEYCDVWSVQDNTMQMPQLSLTATEQERYSALSTDIDTMIDENLVRFVLGDRPMTELDAFIDELKGIGLEEMIGIEQGALDRYMAK